MKPQYPIYIPSKGRWESRWTIRSFEEIGLDFRVVVEPQEFDKYAAYVDPKKILVTPHRDEGVVVTRNWIWDHAQASGTKRYWTFDDNIGEQLKQGVMGLYRLNRNLKVPLATGTGLAIIEQFVERYENIPIAGMNYFMFASRKTRVPPFYLNNRIYSNMLIETNATDPDGKLYRWEGFYNEDTDLCIRVLKDGFCTVLFNALLIYKRTTMTVSGGNTPNYQKDEAETAEELEKDGRWRMAKELQDKHPDITKITRKWGRWQHHVDYSRFRSNSLRLRDDAEIRPGVNDFGLELKLLDLQYKETPEETSVEIPENPKYSAAFMAWM